MVFNADTLMHVTEMHVNQLLPLQRFLKLTSLVSNARTFFVAILLVDSLRNVMNAPSDV